MRKLLYYAEILKNDRIVRKVIGDDLNELTQIVQKWRDNNPYDKFEVIRYFKTKESEVFPRNIYAEKV